MAWADGETGAVVVQTFSGNRLTEIQPPQWRKDASRLTKQGVDDCFFDEGGKFLWVVGPICDEEVEVQLIDVQNWNIVQQMPVEDRFAASDCSLHSTGKPSLVCLWLAAGQDGQQVLWLKRKGSRFTSEQEEQLVNTTPSVFSPDGLEFLVVNEDNAICKYELATMKQIGAPLESEDEDNPFAESLCYLDCRHALASTGEGRLFLVDTDRIRVVEEVELEGHEAPPIGEYYPSLSKERGLGTDISWFTSLGKAVVFVYRRDWGTGLKGWKDSLLWYLVKK